MSYKIKSGYNTVHQKEFYWEDTQKHFRIAVVKGTETLLTDDDLKEYLQERIEEYLHA